MTSRSPIPPDPPRPSPRQYDPTPNLLDPAFSFSPEWPLSTQRLVLRPYTAADLPFLADLRSRRAVTRYLYWEDDSASQAPEALLGRRAATRIDAEQSVLVAVMEVAGQRVGDVCLMLTSRKHRQGEIGYISHPDFRGHGYATEAAAKMLELGFAGLGLHRIAARLDARNIASARVCERLGMRREAHLVHNEWVKGEWTDEVIYALLADEWQSRVSREEASP